MAGDWIKVEKLTPDKPEVAILARKLGVSIGDAFLEWFRIYAWADGMTCPGFVPHLSAADVDKLARAMPRTAEHLASIEIGWLSIRSDGVVFNNWDRHNGKSAKARMLDTERKRKNRGKEPDLLGVNSGQCPVSNGTKAGPEQEESKRRDQLLKSNRKAIGTSDSPLPVAPVDSRLPKDAGTEQRKALDLSMIDWSLVEVTADSIGRKVPAVTPKDRRNWMRFAVMTQLSFSEDWLTDSIQAVVCAKESRKTKQAHLYGVLKAKAAELGLGELFAAMLRDIEIPKEVWKSGVLGGPK